MASAPQSLPVMYNDLVPLSSVDHASWKGRQSENLEVIRNVHAIPLMVEEFVQAQRFHPIVFTLGGDPLPIALFGLNEGINVFLDDAGAPAPDTYVPAYVRRYPFLLVRLRPDTDDLSLCFDPTSNLIGEYAEGTPLFENGEPTQETKALLEFCEQFEMGAQRTQQFMTDLKELNILEEGEISITHPSVEQPFVYRGFQMVNEQKLRDLRGDQLRKISQTGMLAVLHAHLFSLSLMPAVFQKQYDRGLAPTQQPLTL